MRKRRKELSKVNEVRKGSTRLKQMEQDYMNMIREFGMTQKDASKRAKQVGPGFGGTRKGVYNLNNAICLEPNRSCSIKPWTK